MKGEKEEEEGGECEEAEKEIAIRKNTCSPQFYEPLIRHVDVENGDGIQKINQYI